MKMKRITALLLAIISAAALFAGCGGGDVSGQESAPEDMESFGASDGPAYEGATDPITFRMLTYTWQTWDEPMTADPLGRWLIEKTGVTLDVEVITGDAADKFALMLATRDYPDFTYWPGDDMASKFIAEGAFIEYDEYFDKLPNVVSRYGDGIGAVYDIDTGHMYRITHWALGNSIVLNDGMAVRSDFMREYFGEDSLTVPRWITLSELEEAMLDWKENNPVSEDGAVTYPYTMVDLSCVVQRMMQCYGIPVYYDNNGELGYFIICDEMEELLVTLNRWYNNGILDPEFAINKKEGMQTKLTTGVSIAIWTHSSELPQVNREMEEKDPDMFMFCHPKIKSEDRDAVYSKMSTVGIEGLVTMSTVSNLDRALEWINFMNDPEVMFYCCNGLPGDDGFWHYDENGMVDLNEENIEAVPELWERFRKVGAYKYNWMLSEGVDSRFPAWSGNFYEPIHGHDGAEVPKEVYGRYEFWDPEVDTLFNTDLVSGIEPSADSDEGVIKTNLDDIWSYTLPEIIMAENETAARERYQNMVDEMEAAGLRKYLDAVSEKYYAKKKIMGL